MKKTILIIMGLILLVGTVFANTDTVQTTLKANVLPSIELFSPIDGKIYQTNDILVDFNIRTNQKIKDVRLIDNNMLRPLCSKCNNYSKVLNFPDGQHISIIRVYFENGDFIEKNITFFVDSSSDVYIIDNQGILKKATSKEILDYLFNFEFNITRKTDFILDNSCSIRARGGSAVINNKDFGSNNKLNFYVVSSIKQGQVELTAQKGRDFVSYKFKLLKIIESTKDLLKIEIQETKTGNIAILELDKINNKTSIKNSNIAFESMNVYFIDGCNMQKRNYYMLDKGSKITRSIEAIRKILNDNPIFIKKYGNLRNLFSDYWKILYYFI